MNAEINLQALLPLAGCLSWPAGIHGSNDPTTQHDGGKHGTRQSTFEKQIRRPSGTEGVEGAAPQFPARNGAPEDGVHDSRNLIEAPFLASFDFPLHELREDIDMRITERGGRFKTEADYQMTGPEARKKASFAPAGVNVLFETVRHKRAHATRAI